MSVNITPRRMNFDFNLLPENRYFLKNNSVLSTLFVALSTVFPEGERQFVQSVRAYQDQVSDPKQKKEVRAFIGQESHHGNSHEQFNALIEEKWGYPISKFIENQIARHALIQKRFTKAEQLALTAALEHLTAILANQILENRELLTDLHPEVVELFTWHAIEEIEHKAVAFDLLKQVDGDERTRIKMMLIGFTAFATHMMILTVVMLRQDKHLPSFRELRQARQFLFGKSGVIRKSFPDFLDYFKKDFHPWDHNNRHLIEEWENRYPQIAERVVA